MERAFDVISADEPDEDLALDIWAGVLPLRQVAGDPEAHPLLRPDVPTPAYITHYRRPGDDG